MTLFWNLAWSGLLCFCGPIFWKIAHIECVFGVLRHTVHQNTALSFFTTSVMNSKKNRPATQAPIQSCKVLTGRPASDVFTATFRRRIDENQSWLTSHHHKTRSTKASLYARLKLAHKWTSHLVSNLLHVWKEKEADGYSECIKWTCTYSTWCK